MFEYKTQSIFMNWLDRHVYILKAENLKTLLYGINSENIKIKNIYN